MGFHRHDPQKYALRLWVRVYFFLSPSPTLLPCIGVRGIIMNPFGFVFGFFPSAVFFYIGSHYFFGIPPGNVSSPQAQSAPYHLCTSQTCHPGPFAVGPHLGWGQIPLGGGDCPPQGNFSSITFPPCPTCQVGSANVPLPVKCTGGCSRYYRTIAPLFIGS